MYRIRDQILEGLIDDDKVEDLLWEKDLTPFQSAESMQEAAKKQRAKIAGSNSNVQAIRKNEPYIPPPPKGCGSSLHPGGHQPSPLYVTFVRKLAT